MSREPHETEEAGHSDIWGKVLQTKEMAKKGRFWGVKDTCSAPEELEDPFGWDVVSSGQVMGDEVRESSVRQTCRP